MIQSVRDFKDNKSTDSMSDDKIVRLVTKHTSKVLKSS